MKMEYTSQQKATLAAIEDFLVGDGSIFILKGYAGTGKTTLIRPILEMAGSHGKNTILMAPTGRAAKILSEKTGYEASTIHKAIYEFSGVETVDGDEGKESSVQYSFPLRQLVDAKRPGGPQNPSTSLLVIDEASMVSSRKDVDDLFVFGTGVLLDDVLSFARLMDGGKVIFVGDPAQLPPVGDPDSYALDEAYLRGKGLSVESVELTDVVRQASESAILANSIKIRTLINSGIRTELVLERREGEVEDITMTDIASRFCEVCPTPSLGGPVVICYSNKMAAAYNNMIRSRYFPDGIEGIRVGDRLIVVGNNYSIQERTVLNGEFCTVVEFSEEVEKQTGWVYVDVGEAKKKRIALELFFRDVSVQFDDGLVVRTKVFDSLLDNTNPNITYWEQCALVSNFKARCREMKANSPEFVATLKDDPYCNALRAKYGYAITCHKAQGGEWDTTFVDFSGRVGLSKDCLRWSYTAATRARNRMFGFSMHNIPKFEAKVTDVVITSNVPLEYYPDGKDIPAGPFNNDADPAPLKAKYWQVSASLEGSGYKVVGIDHKPYREIYSVSDVDGNIFKCHALYNRAGILRPFISPNPGDAPDDLLALVNGGEAATFPFTYIPSNQNLADLYARVTSACDEIGITIVNIVEHLNNYKVAYYLQTDAYYAYLDVCVNKYGQITYIAPRSEMGQRDVKLAGLVDVLRH